MPIEIVKPGTHIDFLGKWRIAAFVSAAILLAGAAAVAINGVKFGLDFSGGTEAQVSFAEPTSDGAIRDALAALDGAL